MKTWNENAALRGAWRRIFARSPIVIEVLNEGRRKVPRYKKDGARHKVDRVEFQCQVCNIWEIRDRIEVDHIIPVIDPEMGFVDWNTLHDRLFCDKKNLQRICDTCHDKKTAEERKRRTIVKDTAALNLLMERFNDGEIIVADMLKELKKYLGKKKPEVIRQRVLTWKENYLKPQPKKKKRRGHHV